MSERTPANNAKDTGEQNQAQPSNQTTQEGSSSGHGNDNSARVWRAEPVWWGRQQFPQGVSPIHDDAVPANLVRGRSSDNTGVTHNTGTTETQSHENVNAAVTETNTTTGAVNESTRDSGSHLAVPQGTPRAHSYERTRNPAPSAPRNTTPSAEWLAREREGKNTGDERYRDYWD